MDANLHYNLLMAQSKQAAPVIVAPCAEMPPVVPAGAQYVPGTYPVAPPPGAIPVYHTTPAYPTAPIGAYLPAEQYVHQAPQAFTYAGT